MDKGRWFLCLPIACLATLSLLSDARAEPAAPAITRQQIEADWLRQRDLRERPIMGVTVRREDDAAGGCDGVKNGTWGFHTALENDPWWRVDLGQPTAIDHLLLFNRCDEGPERNARLIVSLSDDDKTWRKVYQHNGTVFYGYTDEAAGGEAPGDQGPLCPAAPCRQDLPALGRGRGLRGGRCAECGPGQAGHAEQRQSVVGRAPAGGRRARRFAPSRRGVADHLRRRRRHRARAALGR